MGSDLGGPSLPILGDVLFLNHLSGLALTGVLDRVQDDVRDVVVGEGVLDLACQAAGRDDAGRAQHAQVLGDKGLAYAKGGD